MATTSRRDWNVADDKRAAILDVLRYIMSQPEHVGQKCIADDNFARRLFEDPAIGNIDVPKHAKTVFMPPGELALKARGSVVIELPPHSTEEAAALTSESEDLLKYVLCCYIPW